MYLHAANNWLVDQCGYGMGMGVEVEVDVFGIRKIEIYYTLADYLSDWSQPFNFVLSLEY